MTEEFDKFLNHTVYTLLERIGDFQNYYSKIVSYIAAICFAMAFGMAVIKIIMNVADARQEIVRLFMTLIIYFVMIFIYPSVMKGILPFAMNLGYGAVFGGGLYEVSVDSSQGNGVSVSDFYTWLDKSTNGIFTTTETGENLNGKGAKLALNFNIVDENTGYIDINKTFSFIWAFIRIGWTCFPKLTLFKIDGMTLAAIVIFLFALLLVVICFLVVLINYVMALIDYFALMGFGILMVPLSLWEGTKSYTQALIGGIGKILIKLMVISAFLFLSVMSIVDIYTQVYLYHKSPPVYDMVYNIGGLLDMSISLLFQGPILAVLTMQSSKIAGFLSGGNPEMSFGEFAGAVGQMGAAGYAAAKMGGRAINNIGNGAAAVSKAIGSGVTAAGLGGGGRSIAKSIGGSLASSAGGQLKDFGKSLKNNAGGIVNTMGNMTGLSRGLNSETFGGLRASDVGLGGSSSGSGGNSGNGGFSDGSSSGSSEGGMQNESDSALDNFQNGSEGVYGNAPENSTKMSDNLIRSANQMANSKNYMSRRMAFYSGLAGNVMKNVESKMNERHTTGNQINNGYAKSIAKGIGSGFSGAMAGMRNSGSGFDVRMSNGDDNVSNGLKGESFHVNHRGNSSTTENVNGENYKMNLVGENGKGTDSFDGLNDSDALSMLKGE